MNDDRKRQQDVPNQSGPVISPEDPHYEDLVKVWRHMVQGELPAAPDPETMARGLRRKMADSGQEKTLFRQLRPWLLPAIILLVFGFAILFVARTPHTYRTRMGQRLEGTLPDGTLFAINADSRLRLNKGFPSTGRLVLLEGEAFFSVTRHSHPFEVRTGRALVRVTGTKFNVYARKDRTEIGVTEGRVLVVPEEGPHTKSLTLEAGQRITWRRGDFPKSPETLNTADYPPWRYGHLAFDGASMAEVCSEIERKFGVVIVLGNQALAEKRVSGYFVGEDAVSFVTSLCILTGTSYRQKGDRFTIF